MNTVMLLTRSGKVLVLEVDEPQPGFGKPVQICRTGKGWKVVTGHARVKVAQARARATGQIVTIAVEVVNPPQAEE